MLFTIQKYFAKKASADAANWFAENIENAIQELDLHEGNSDFPRRMRAFEGMFPSLVATFVQKSPPQWPGQGEFLKMLSYGDDLVFAPHCMELFRSSRGKLALVALCTEYFSSGFDRVCRSLLERGDQKGGLGQKQICDVVEKVFEQRGINAFFRMVDAFYADPDWLTRNLLS